MCLSKSRPAKAVITLEIVLKRTRNKNDFTIWMKMMRSHGKIKSEEAAFFVKSEMLAMSLDEAKKLIRNGESG